MTLRDGASPPDPARGSVADRPPIRRVLVFTIISFALMMMAIDSTIVATALHALQHDLDAPINWVGWTITAYSFGFVLMLPITGRLSEQFGRRRIFLVSVIAFTAASLLCGFATNIYTLIALRAVQAAGGAVIGPIFGGLFVTYWSWRGIFWVNVPIGITVIALALRHIPSDRPETRRARTPTDFAGMLLLGVGLFAGMFAISELGERGAHAWSPGFVLSLVVAVAALWLFLRHLRRAANPFIAPRFIYGPGFGAVNVINAIYGGVRSGVVALVPLYAIQRYGIDALRSGTLLVAQGIATILLSVAAALVIRRTGYRKPIYIGGAIIVAGTLLLAVAPGAHVSPYAWLAGAASLVGAGGGALNPATRNAGLQLAPEHSSTLAALRTMALQIGAIATVSIATAVLAGSRDPGITQAWIYVATALVLMAGMPLAMRIPEHRGAW